MIFVVEFAVAERRHVADFRADVADGSRVHLVVLLQRLQDPVWSLPARPGLPEHEHHQKRGREDDQIGHNANRNLEEREYWKFYFFTPVYDSNIRSIIKTREVFLRFPSNC